MNANISREESGLFAVINKLMLIIAFLVVGLAAIPVILFFSGRQSDKPQEAQNESVTSGSSFTKTKPVSEFWIAPDINSITDATLKSRVEYGRELIAHTAKYLGPKGSVKQISNGMNCQNCHLQAGTVVFGNNYGSVASMYPKFRARSGKQEDIYKRVNDCFERSLNGTALDTASKEMQAIKSYMVFLGSNVQKGEKAPGSGFKELAYLDRAADPAKGKMVYESKCKNCHQENGEGLLMGEEYSFPPLWGKNSYNDGAGLFRLSNFARYVKYNMPQGATHDNPQLSDEEAWDVAAFVNTMARPHKSTPKDWPDISKKPVDHPFGPYADQFTEQQHKYGPFKPIADEQKKREQSVKGKTSTLTSSKKPVA